MQNRDKLYKLRTVLFFKLLLQGGAPESAVVFELKSLKGIADSGVPPCISDEIWLGGIHLPRGQMRGDGGSMTMNDHEGEGEGF